MIYPNIWGRGAIVGFSGLEGPTTFADNMFGQLMAEHIGISLDDGAAEIYLRQIGIPWIREFDFSVVCSDLIEGKLTQDEGGEFRFLFLNQSTLAGAVTARAAVPIFHADLGEETAFEGGRAFRCEKGWYAFAAKEMDGMTRFAVCRRETMEEAGAGAKEALDADLDAVAERYRAYFSVVPKLHAASDAEQLTLAKCFSIMKSQVYTADGVFKTRWTTPERTPHKKCWLWDSVFHSLGNVYIDPQLAYETLHALLDMQLPDGLIPSITYPTGETSAPNTQPPLIAWAVYRLYEKAHRLDWVEEFYGRLKTYLNWVMKNRDQDQNYLYEWLVRDGDPTCHCGESGMDNSPRFDTVRVMDAVDFSCYMANEMRYMEKIARLLHRDDEAGEFASLYAVIRDRVNEVLYDEKDGRYYDRDIETGKLMKVSTPAGFLPLFAGVCPPERAKRLVEDIFDPKTFGTAMPLPTVALDDPTHSIDYWRGMVWINYCYMVQQGLLEYGFSEEARRMADAVIAEVAKWYMREGSVFEIYDPHGVLSPWELERKGKVLEPEDYFMRLAPVRDFGWSSSLYVAMVMEREG